MKLQFNNISFQNFEHFMPNNFIFKCSTQKIHALCILISMKAKGTQMEITVYETEQPQRQLKGTNICFFLGERNKYLTK